MKNLLSHPEQSKFTNYTITYNMKTNDKIVDNAKDILSSSTLVLNDSSLKSNIVKTTLWDILEIKKEWKSKNPNIDVNVTLKRKVGMMLISLSPKNYT